VRVLLVVVSGVLILAFATVAVATCESSEGDLHGVGLLVLFAAGLVRLALSSRAGDAGAAGTGSGPSSVRRGPPDPRPQLAGSACAHCEQKIMLELEAALCKTCDKPLHRDCRKPHKTDAHRELSGQAYR
jgi:hypothetical protein